MGATPAGNSRVSTWLKCKRKALFVYGYKRIPTGRDLPLVIGDEVHKALHIVEKKEDWAQAMEKNFQALTAKHHMVDFTKAHEMSHALVSAYIYKWDEEDAESYAVELSEPECTYTARLPNGLDWTARLDLVRKERLTGRLFIFERKTVSGNRGAEFAKQYYTRRSFLDRQITGQVWLAQHALKLPVVGMYYDLLVKTALPICTRVGPILRSKEDLHNWERDVMTYQAELYNAFLRWNRAIEEEELDTYESVEELEGALFPRNTDECVDWFGKDCPYHNVCVIGKHVLEDNTAFMDTEEEESNDVKAA